MYGQTLHRKKRHKEAAANNGGVTQMRAFCVLFR